MSEQKVSPVTQAQVARDFDNATGDYEAKINSAIAFAGMEHSFYIDIKREHILRLGREHFSNLKELDVLDLGCGLGAYHPGLEGKFRELHGIDVSAQSVELATARQCCHRPPRALQAWRQEWTPWPRPASGGPARLPFTVAWA